MMENTQDTKSPTIHLRQAQTDDAPLLVSILHASFEEYRGQFEPPPGVFRASTDSIRSEMQQGQFIIAYVGENAAGCVYFQPYSDHVYLGHLAVLPAYRKQGVARVLVDHVERQTAALHLPGVQLGVRLVLPHLQAYYTRLGYRLLRYGTHEGFSQPTYAIMEKELPQ